MSVKRDINDSPLSPKPNAVFAHIKLTHFHSFHGIGTIGIDHRVSSAKFLSLPTIQFFSHNFESPTAAQTKNHVTAIQNIDIIKFHTPTASPPIFTLIIHHNISFRPDHSDSSNHRLPIIVTKTVDKLTAKQITAGEKIIGIRKLLQNH